jgi:hypothetical protein
MTTHADELLKVHQINGRFTGESLNDMKRQDDPDKATRVLHRAQRERTVGEFIKRMELLYDLLDSGKSLEELAIDVDIGVAGDAISESSHEFCRVGLKIIRRARKEGAGRNEVMTFLRDNLKARCEVTERDGDDFYTRTSRSRLRC